MAIQLSTETMFNPSNLNEPEIKRNKQEDFKTPEMTEHCVCVVRANKLTR